MATQDATRRRTAGPKAQLPPLEGPGPRKIFSKKDLVESVRKMAPARYGQNPSKPLGAVSSSTPIEGGSQLKVMEAGVNANASKYNELKLLANRKEVELKQREDNLRCLKLENSALTEMKQNATPEAVRIEHLLKSIEETREITDEKLHYRRQLQHMYRRLANNQITFDAHINALEDALKAAIKEHDDVKGLMRQLEAGKTKGLIDLMDIERQISVERRDRAKILSVRRMEASNAQKMEEWRKERENSQKNDTQGTRGDCTVTEERQLQTKLDERERLFKELELANKAKYSEYNSLEEQFASIRQATGVNGLEEMVDKFIGQEGNRHSLLQEQLEVESKLATAKEAKEAAEAKFSKLKQEGIGSNELNREVSDELSAEIQAGRMDLKVTRAACERLENVLVSLRQGAIGLFQRLEPHRYLLDDDDEVHATNESSATIDPVEALGLSELILAKMMENVGGGDAEPQSRANGGTQGDGEEDKKEDPAQAAPDDVSSTWTALANDDIPSGTNNVRIKTFKKTQEMFEDVVEQSLGGAGGGGAGGGAGGGGGGSAVGKSEVLVPKETGSSVGEDDGPEKAVEMVPTRDFLKLSASRQHAEVVRKQEMESRRKKMQERYDAADEKEKEKLGSLADKKKRQREAIEHLCQKKGIMGVPPGITPKLDAMTRSTVFLNHKPELL